MKIARNLVIVFGVLLLCVFLIPEEAKADPVCWDGSVNEPTVMRAVDGVYFYEISTPAQLAYIATTGGEWYNYNYILVNDIVMNDTVLTYDTSGNLTADTTGLRDCPSFADFQGIFDGDGHYISGLYITGENYVGLFRKLRGSVKNLTVKNAYILGSNYVGGICGFSDIANKEISNCEFSGAVKGASYVSGITGGTDGYSGSIIYDCVNNGDIFAIGHYAGGIVGTNHSAYTASIRDCTNNGKIISEGDYVGGIAGSYFWYITNCTNNGSITGVNYVGGLSGSQAVMPRNCINFGSVTGTDRVGGIVGRISRGNESMALYNAGAVTGKTNVGGICGSTVQEFNDEYVELDNVGNSGDVNGESNVGGLIGYAMNVVLSNSVNTGKISGNTESGTLIGHSESIWGRGSVTNCYYLSGVNPGMLAFGNAPEDTAGIAEAKDADFFCFQENKTVRLHYYETMKYDENNHWLECHCGRAAEYFVHTPNNAARDDWRCTACGYEHEDTNDDQYGGSGNENGGNNDTDNNTGSSDSGNNNSGSNDSGNNNSGSNDSGNNDSGNNSGLGIFGDGSKPKRNNTGTIIFVCIFCVSVGVAIAMFASMKKK